MNEAPVHWRAVMEEAWSAFLHGSFPIGACVVNAQGSVIARGRNRLGEGRRVEGIVSGHRLAHAEVNALLALPELSADECRALTLVSSVEPCPMCLGAMLMQRIPALAYAAADPWAGHTEALDKTFYFSQKTVTIRRAPPQVERFCTVLLLSFFLGGEMPREHGFFSAHQQFHPDYFASAVDLHRHGVLKRLREDRQLLTAALAVLA